MPQERAGWFDHNPMEPEMVKEGKKRGYAYFHEDKRIEAGCTVRVRNIPCCINEEDFLPAMLMGGPLNWGWENGRIVAVNILREEMPLPGRTYVNVGVVFIKFRRRDDLI